METEVAEIEIQNTEQLPWSSRIYQNLKKDKNTIWLAKLIKNPTFRNLLKIGILIFYFLIGCVYYDQKEGWTIGTTVFFSIVTMTTVGSS
jgi:hypothetical protein